MIVGQYCSEITVWPRGENLTKCSLCRVFELKICCHLKFLHWTNSCVVQLRAQTDTEGVVELRRWTERVYPIGRINDSSNENVISIQVVNSVTRSLVINLMW